MNKNKEKNYLIVLLVIITFMLIIFNFKIIEFASHPWLFLLINLMIAMLFVIILGIINKKVIWIGSFIGGIFGFLSPLLIQTETINFICPRINALPYSHTKCVGNFYLSLFGTTFSGGNWHLIFYDPVFITTGMFIGSFIGFIIYNLKRKLK